MYYLTLPHQHITKVLQFVATLFFGLCNILSMSSYSDSSGKAKYQIPRLRLTIYINELDADQI